MNTSKNYQKGFSKIDRLLTSAAKQYNLETALYRHKIQKYWHEVAESFVEGAKEQTQAMDLKRGVLTVACLSKQVAQKLKLLAQRIMHTLNQILGKQIVYAINIQL